MAGKANQVPKGTVNHDDTMRCNLLRAVVDSVMFNGYLTGDQADAIFSRLRDAPPSDFKKLMNEGVSAKSTLYYSKILQMVTSPRVAIEVGASFAKYPTVNQRDADVTRNAALSTYIASELEVRDFEETKLEELSKSPLFFRVRAEMRKLLSDFYPHSVIENLRFGPGSTSTPSVKLQSQKHAWLIRNNGIVLPREIYEYFANRGLLKEVASTATSLARDIVHLTERFIPNPSVAQSFVPFFEEVTTVPKDATTDRPISTFPVGITLISVSANSALSKVINLADQRVEFVYQDKCSGKLDDVLEDGEEFKSTATLDLKDASGHVSWQLLTRLIDNSDVLELLRALRAPFSRFVLREEKSKGEVMTILESNPSIAAANSSTMSHLLGISEIKHISEDSDVWERVVSKNPWLQTLVQDGKVPYFYEIETRGKYHHITIDVMRYSHAGMGSGVTFPIMAALIAAILRAHKVYSFRVFGDDIILTDTSSKEVQSAIAALELFGLVVNRQKSCYGDNPIREAVGSWWFNEASGVRRFYPVYVREDLSSLFTLQKDPGNEKKFLRCKDLRVIHYAVMLHNYLVRLGKHEFAQVLARVISKNSAVPIARVAQDSGLFGLEVVPEDLWSWYAPVFKGGVLASVRQRLSKNIPSFTNGVVELDKSHDVIADRDLQVIYLKIKGITPVVFDKPTPGSFIDEDLLPIRQSFVQDSFFLSLGTLSNDCLKPYFNDWVRVCNSITSTNEDRKSSDRPEKGKTLFHQVSSRLEIPLEVIIAWENQELTT